ncbi:hypothetical protein GVX81_05980 [[Haemophilus] felis]|uniref:Uncharacterized protein n=1 Tax=[Haemophilus] felis TaxID=123822 RepID=A0A1T0B3F4_9PAST|nr:hypothetical protein [[Haemophilus] felis]NBI40685.1 hypothetical protein [[Haemophilus] felis]NBI42596.1 hypothetical protein [[Haemophilus] felis]OOS04675.1 hypothetical protein B0188_04650 [[Haemophilus] felis]
MSKPINAPYIQEIIQKTNGLGYMEIKGQTAEERKQDLILQIQRKLARHKNDDRENSHHRG